VNDNFVDGDINKALDNGKGKKQFCATYLFTHSINTQHRILMMYVSVVITTIITTTTITGVGAG
jgi:hypothetical protein